MLTDQEIEVRDAAAYALGFCPGGTQNEQADQTLCVRGELLSGFVRFVRLLGLICSPLPRLGEGLGVRAVCVVCEFCGKGYSP